MTIPTWNQAEVQVPRLEQLLAVGNVDDMNVSFDISRVEVRRHYQSTTETVNVSELLRHNLLSPDLFTVEQDEFGGTHMTYDGSDSQLRDAIDTWANDYMDWEDTFYYVDSHDEEHQEYTDESLDGYVEWE
tara:strand:+ start:6620 stop:7012 length:393 start_codon:yes stop_codon:yes gene_type:complete